MKKSFTIINVFSIFAILYGIGMIFEGIEDYVNMQRIIYIASGGLILLASILSWIKNETSWIFCIIALLLSFLLHEVQIIMTIQKWYYIFAGFFQLAYLLILFQPNVRDLFFMNKEHE